MEQGELLCIRHVFRCTLCKAERVWGSTETRENVANIRDHSPAYVEIRKPLLSCSCRTPRSRAVRHTPHEFVRYEEIRATLTVPASQPSAY